MTLPLSNSPKNSSKGRWTFFRDVAVFQLKLFLDNVRDFALMPVSLAAALIDVAFRGEREGALFYKVLKWGAHSEKVINVYSAIEPHELSDFKIHSDYTVDGVIERLEGVLVREYEKGGTAASIKTAMDRAIDQLHAETGAARHRAQNVVVRATGALRAKFDNDPEKKE